MSDPAEDFIAEFKRWRDVRNLSQNALAAKMAFSRSYISKIETGAERPSVDFARVADDVLQAGGAIRRAFADYDRHRADNPAEPRFPPLSELANMPPHSLVVEH